MSAVYAKMANNHRHENGPWKMIVERVLSLNLQAGSRILDIASGQGEPAATIAEALPSVVVFSSDVSPDMHQIAAKHSVRLDNFKALVQDAQSLSAFPDASVDCIVCCYGWMFPADKVKALSEAHRVLKPGGALISTYWLTVNLLALTADIMKEVVGSAAPPAMQMNPLSLREPGAFDGLLKQAGFSGTQETVESSYPFDLGGEPSFQYKSATLLIRNKIDEMGAHEAARKAFENNVSKYAEKDEAGNLVIGGNTFVMSTVFK